MLSGQTLKVFRGKRGLQRFSFAGAACLLACFTALSNSYVFIITVAVLIIASIALIGSFISPRPKHGLHQEIVRLHTALNNMHEGLCMFDGDARLVVCNERYLHMYGVSAAVAKPGCTLLAMLEHRKQCGSFMDDPAEYEIKIREAARRGEELKVVIELADGRIIEVVNQPLADGGWVAIHEEVTERVCAERDRARAERFLHAVVEHMPATVFVKEAHNQRYVLLNRAGEELLGVSRNDVIGKTAKDIFPSQQALEIGQREQKMLNDGNQLFVKETAFQTPQNGTRIVNVKRVAIPDDDGKPHYILGVAEDITDRKRADAKISFLAHHDALTNLPSRAAFNECFSATLERAKTSGEPFALLCLDLDRFKTVNDLFGHSIGDALLCEVAKRLEAVARGAFLARMGGDEFIFILTEGPLPDSAARLAERVITALGDHINVEGRKLAANASVGIAIYPYDETEGGTLISNADAALYRAKTEGPGSLRFFDPGMDRQLRETRALQHDLKHAIENKEFVLHYQPVADIDGTIVGFEALVRWQHPSRGLVAPLDFIPLAEETGLINSLGEWILRSACREAASWPRPMQIAINLSPAQFRQGDLPSLTHSILLETGLSPSQLELEITEGILIDDFGHVQAILRRLKSLGVKIALDDFGTGYSSLSYLQSFPFDKIKIDQSFVSNIETNYQTAAIVSAIINLARGLQLPVLAEGVENEQQWSILERAGCDQIQGYLLGKPMPIASYGNLLKSGTNKKTPRQRRVSIEPISTKKLSPFVRIRK